MTASLAMVLLVLPLTLLAGCDREVRDMARQPRLPAGASSPLWPDGLASRQPPAHSVAYSGGTRAATSSGQRGLREETASDAAPPRPDRALLLRGQERYTIYCLPCHSPLGDGQGPIVMRGFPAPPSLHLPRLRDAPDAHLFDVITNGHGVMPAYGDRLDAADRRAVIAYVRVLQASQHWPLERLPAALRAQLPPPPGGAR